MHQRLGSEIFHWGSDHRAYVQLWLQHPATLGQHPCADCLLQPKRDFDLKDFHHNIWHHWDLLICFQWETRRFRIWNSIWIKALSHAATSLDFVELLSHARTRYDCDLGPGTIVILRIHLGSSIQQHLNKWNLPIGWSSEQRRPTWRDANINGTLMLSSCSKGWCNWQNIRNAKKRHISKIFKPII